MRWLYPKTGYVRTSHYKWIGWKAECFYGSTDFMKFDPIWGFWLWMPLTLPPVWVKVLATPQQRDEWSMAQDWWEGFLWHGRELNCIVLDLLDVNQRCKIIAPCSKQNHALAPSFAQEFTRRSCILTSISWHVGQQNMIIHLPSTSYQNPKQFQYQNVETVTRLSIYIYICIHWGIYVLLSQPPNE